MFYSRFPEGFVVECGWLTCNISGNPTPNGSFDGRPVKHWARLMPQLQGRQIFLTQAPRDSVGQGLSVLSVLLSALLLWIRNPAPFKPEMMISVVELAAKHPVSHGSWPPPPTPTIPRNHAGATALAVCRLNPTVPSKCLGSKPSNISNSS